MQTIGDVLTNARADSPWLVLVAAALLAAAAQVGRRLFGSVARIGGRVGQLERLTDSEQTRRRQLEGVLLELGVPLPVWPADPVNLRELAVLRRRVQLAAPAEDDDQDDDEAGAYPLTRESPLPPPPTRAGSAAHRR